MKLFGSLTSITFSPIVTIEPRRRKFHCPIKLKIPLPSGYRSDLSANLHLLCSITGGQNKALWEDVTGSTPLSIVEDCLIFTTTVSARFWLIHCSKSQYCINSTKYANEIYRNLIAVPFMATFVIFAKRRDINEASIRIFCMTDDKEERTLEVQEHYTQVAKSRDVEVLESQTMYLEFGGNLIPILNGQRNILQLNSSILINEQLAFVFHAFQENRLAFLVRSKEVGQEAKGRIAFMEESIRYLTSLNAQQRAYLNEKRRRAICTLGIVLPSMCVNYDNILGTPKRNSYYATARIGDLTLTDIANELDSPRLLDYDDTNSLVSSTTANRQQRAMATDEDSLYSGGDRTIISDWIELAPRIGIPKDEVDFITEYCIANQIQQDRSVISPALILLMHWYKLASPDTRDQDLARALVSIGRDDIAKKLNFPIEAKKMSRSTMELLREIELIPVRSTENLYSGSELGVGSRIGLGGNNLPSRGHSLRRLDNQQLGDTYNIRSSSRSSIERPSYVSQQQRRDSSSNNRQALGSSSRTEINIDPESGTRVSSKDWTLDNDGKMNVMFKQTTHVESKPPSSSSKKQRRRRGNMKELIKADGPIGVNNSSDTSADDGSQDALKDNQIVSSRNQNDLIDKDEQHLQLNFKSEVKNHGKVEDLDKIGEAQRMGDASKMVADQENKPVSVPQIDFAGQALGGATEPGNLRGSANISDATGEICRSVGGMELSLDTLAQREQRAPSSSEQNRNSSEFQRIFEKNLDSDGTSTTIVSSKCLSEYQRLDSSYLNTNAAGSDTTVMRCPKENSFYRKIDDSILVSITTTTTQQSDLDAPNQRENVDYATTELPTNQCGGMEEAQLSSDTRERDKNRQENEQTTSNTLAQNMCHDPNSSSIAPLSSARLGIKIEEDGSATGLASSDWKESEQQQGNATEFKDRLANSLTKDIDPTKPSDGVLDEVDSKQENTQRLEMAQLLLLCDSSNLDAGSSDTNSDTKNEIGQYVDSGRMQSETIDIALKTCESTFSQTNILDKRENLVMGTTTTPTRHEQPSKKDCLTQCQEREGSSLSDVSNNKRARLSGGQSDSSERLKLEFGYEVPDTNSGKSLPFDQTSASTTSCSDEDLVEKSALAEDMELNGLRNEQRHSIPEELKTTKHFLLGVEQPEKFLAPTGNQLESEGRENLILSRNFSESLSSDCPKSENTESRKHRSAENSRRLSGNNNAQKYHSEAQTSKVSMKKDFGRNNSSKSTPSLNRRSFNKNQQSSTSSQGKDQSSSYVTAPLEPFISSSSSNVEFPSTSASLYETAFSNLTKASNIEQDLGHSNCTITDSNNNNNANTASEMANFSTEDKQELTISSEAYLSTSNVGSPTITPNTEDPEDLGGSIVDEEEEEEEGGEALANQTVALGNSPVPSSSQAVTSKNIATELSTQQIQQSEMKDLNIFHESVEEDQINRMVLAKRLSEGNNRYNASLTRKNSLHITGEMPPLTEGEPIRYTLSRTSQNLGSNASSTSSSSLRQSKHLPEVSKRGSQDGSVSCSSSTSPSKRRGSTVSQCSSVLSEEARNQLNFDLSPDLPLETSLLEANSISSSDLCRPISPEPSLMSGDQLDLRPESRLLDEDIICSLSQDVSIDCSAKKTAMEATEANLVHDVAFEEAKKIKEYEAKREGEMLDKNSDETDSMIFDDSLDRPCTSSASSFYNDTIIENVPSSSSKLTSQILTDHGRKSASPASRIPTTSLKSSRSSSVNENRRESDNRAVSSRTPDAQKIKTNRFSNRSSTLNSPSIISNNDLDKHRSANSTCSSSSSSHSSSRGSPKPQTRGHQGNENDYRLLNVIKIERKSILASQNQRLTPDSGVRSSSELPNKITTVPKKRIESSGHRHGNSNNNSASICYCHNY